MTLPLSVLVVVFIILALHENTALRMKIWFIIYASIELIGLLYLAFLIGALCCNRCPEKIRPTENLELSTIKRVAN